MSQTRFAKKTPASVWGDPMHLRNRQVQKTLHGLRQSGHLVVVCKPGEIEGVSYSEVQQRINDVIEEMRE